MKEVVAEGLAIADNLPTLRSAGGKTDRSKCQRSIGANDLLFRVGRDQRRGGFTAF
jgi:hypothetical protein